MTYVGQPTTGEYSFQYADVPEEKQIATNIIDILNEGKEWDRVSLKAKVIQKEEAIQVESKKVKLAVATVADLTASIPFDIWEKHIQRIEIGQVYLMEPLQQKEPGNPKEDQHYANKRRPRTKGCRNTNTRNHRTTRNYHGKTLQENSKVRQVQQVPGL